ncbi:MAG: FAD-binding protein [Candidatus Riflebacteria bacterium]|nr:FAD-binding protein [Candidatus Riflebacteria bacterium]
MPNTTDRQFEKFLSEIDKSIITTSTCDRTFFAYDATNSFVYPSAVVRPRNTDELQNVIRAANATRTPIIPRGAGTGFSGGSLATSGGVVLDLLQLNRIIEIDEEDMMVQVEPGVILRDLHEAVEKKNLYYPPDPASLKTCTIGGNVAENAGGPHCLKYGVTGDYVMIIEAFTGKGDFFSAGKAIYKNRAGYDLKKILIGSEGTLAVFSAFRLKLIAKPESKMLFLAFFADLTEAGKTVNRLLCSGIVPSSIEFMDQNTIIAVEKFAKFGIPTEYEALLLIEIDGRVDEMQPSKRKVEKVLENSAKKVQFADDPREQEKLWEIRRKSSPAMRAYGNTKINEDIVVPRKHVPAAVRTLWEIEKKNSVKIISFGHIGDGNIHVNIMHDGKNQEEVKRAHIAVQEIFEMVNSMGGAVSGEHGVGSSKIDYLPRNIDPVSLQLMREIKSIFDPNNILNPEKIFRS